MENVDALGEFETQVLIRIFNFLPPNTPFQCKTILNYQETYRLEFGFNPFKKKSFNPLKKKKQKKTQLVFKDLFRLEIDSWLQKTCPLASALFHKPYFNFIGSYED